MLVPFKVCLKPQKVDAINSFEPKRDCKAFALITSPSSENHPKTRKSKIHKTLLPQISTYKNCHKVKLPKECGPSRPLSADYLKLREYKFERLDGTVSGQKRTERCPGWRVQCVELEF